jgi:hypothetical protein
MEHILYALIKIKVDFDEKLSPEEAKSQFEQECTYNFPDTKDVVVIETEWVQTEIKKSIFDDTER